MSKYIPYKSKVRPAQGQKPVLFTDQEMRTLAEERFIDLFGLSVFAKVQMVHSYKQFVAFCVDHELELSSSRKKRAEKQLSEWELAYLPTSVVPDSDRTPEIDRRRNN